MSGPNASGSLAERSLPRLLLDLHRDRFDGHLALERGRTTKRIGLLEGAPVSAETNVPAEGLAAVLAEAGRISAEDREKVERLLERERCPEGAALLALKLIEPRALFHAIREQIPRRIAACFEWSDGSWTLEPDGELPPDAQAFRCDPIRLVRVGLGESWDAARLGADLTDRLAAYPVPRRSYAATVRRLGDDPEIAAVCQAIDGRRTLAQALGARGASPAVLAAVWVLDACDTLEYREAALAGEDEATGAPEIEIEIAGTPEPAAAADAQPAASPSAAQPAAASATNPEADKMRQEILDRHARIDELSHYEVLGLERNCAAGDVRKAYFKAAKRYHPDALSRLQLGEVKAQAGEVFARIGEAYAVLFDADRRANYDAQLDGGAGDEHEAARIAQAETFYRKGEILVKMGNFRDALEFLESAVELWPEEAAYQAALGWALYKKAPPEPERAAEHLGVAIRLAPEDAVVNFRLGVVMRALGQEQRATELMARARQLDPDVS